MCAEKGELEEEVGQRRDLKSLYFTFAALLGPAPNLIFSQFMQMSLLLCKVRYNISGTRNIFLFHLKESS